MCLESRSSKKIRLDFADLNEQTPTEESNSNSSEAIPKIRAGARQKF